MKNYRVKAKILAQARVKENVWHCALAAGEIARAASPGQFINVRVSDGCDPLLRRPLSIHGVSGAKIRILYAVVGRATEILSRKKGGDYLDIIGPLGNGFDLGRQKTEDRRRILVAGGMGVAPLVFLAERLREDRRQKTEDGTVVLVGAKTKKELLCVNDFKKLGCAVKVATDDGSQGFRGRVTDLLRHLSSDICPPTSVIYGCGPRLMLKAVADIA
ncbi:MAG: dihydroorotate dehydrogenase electron transfer subunit, partial [Candidatus Omnitrophota bacterium]